MKNRLNLCPCGSGLPKEVCCNNTYHVNVWTKNINSPKEHQEILDNLKISAEFDMRYRGLFKYYGKDLIAYKRLYGSNKNIDGFLKDFSKYMTDHLEDDCPPSWDQCNSSFWEELIFGYLPLCIKITTTKKEIEIFLSQLKHFVRWLDKRGGTSWYDVVEQYIKEATPPLKQCEHLFNQLFIIHYPNIHHMNWNYKQAIEKINQQIQGTTDRLDSIFKVTDVREDTIIVTELKTHRSYPLIGLPCNSILPGMLLDGILGRRKEDMFWNWYFTNAVLPERAEKFIVFI